MHCLILFLAVTANPIIDSEDAPRSLQSHAFDSIFRVDQTGTGTGTGFAVHCQPHDGQGKFAVFIVTAWHCVDGDGTVRVHSVRTTNAPSYVGSYEAHVVATDTSADIAVLKAVSDREIPCLRIAAFDGPTASSSPCPAITIGCSDGDFPTIWNVESEGRKSHDDLAGDPWVIDRYSIPGRSGGPLICTDFTNPDFGRVLGVCARNKEDHSYFTDTSRLRQAVANAGVPSESFRIPGDQLSPAGFLFSALRIVVVVILCTFIRL